MWVSELLNEQVGLGKKKKMGKSTTSSSIKIKCGNKQHDDHEEVMKTGPWSSEEDQKLIDFIRNNNGHPGNWRSLPKLAGHFVSFLFSPFNSPSIIVFNSS